MLLGAMVPDLGKKLSFIPAICMIIQLLLSFLTTTDPDTPLDTKIIKDNTKFLALKMFIIPLISWGVFKLFMPDYALGALLLSGAAVGVMAPVLTLMVAGDIIFCIGAVILSSLIMPFSLPLISGLVTSLSGAYLEGLWGPFLKSGIFLFISMLIPFSLAKFIWWQKSAWAEAILEKRYSISLLAGCLANFIIFSQFSRELRENLHVLMDGLIAAFFLALILFILGLVFSSRKNSQIYLSQTISIVSINSVLTTITAAQFFSLNEVIFGALYSLPFFCAILPYSYLSRYLNRKK